MSRIFFAFASLVAWTICAETELPLISSVNEANRLSHSDFVRKRPFDLSGSVTFSDNTSWFVLDDGTGCAILKRPADNPLAHPPRAGDHIRAQGSAVYHNELYERLQPDSITTLGHSAPPAPFKTSLAHANDPTNSLRILQVTGVIRASFDDEIDNQWHCLVLRDNDATILVTSPKTSSASEDIHAMVGATVQVTGLALKPLGLRKFSDPTLRILSDDDIVLLNEPPNPFDVPELEHYAGLTKSDVQQLGRRRVTGQVLALWSEDRIIVKTSDGRILRIDLASTVARPSPGSIIRISGMPTTDLFRLNLSEAVWENLSPTDPIPSIPKSPILSSEQFHAEMQNPRNMVINFGRTVRIDGVVCQVQPLGKGAMRINLDVNGLLVPVEIAQALLQEEIGQGYRIEATGTFVTESTVASPFEPFLRLSGFAIIPNAAEDIRILSRPPWWTPARLSLVITILMIALVAVFLWNRWLKVLIDRRGRELVREQTDRVGAELRIDERTRLAVELHDSLSQNLSGIACQLNVAKLTLDGQSETLSLLQTAERMLQSSRTELTRCIWDLRGDTLEEADFAEAIRKTLAPLALTAEVLIDFNVSRARVSDLTAHALLCVIRELVANAERHGKASTIRIKGDFNGQLLTLSVTDNGRGFDPDNHPGISEGHFGLAGIRDRLNRLGGSICFTSSPFKETTAVLTISLLKPAPATKTTPCAR